MVSRIQQLRREAGLAVSDRIEVVWSTDDERLVEAISEHGDYIKAEVLANALHRDRAAASETLDIEGVPLAISINAA